MFKLSNISTAPSALNIIASENIDDALNDLNIPEGKSIAELLYEQEENKQKDTQETS